MLRSGLFLGALTAIALAVAGPSQAAEVTVKMMNTGPDGPMDFDPSFVKVAVGDTVKFVATDPGHNVESVKGMAPEGATPVKSELSKDISVTFDKEGVYGFKCAPHFTMGMVALVAVGSKLDNLAAAKEAKVNKKAKERFDAAFAKVGQ